MKARWNKTADRKDLSFVGADLDVLAGKGDSVVTQRRCELAERVHHVLDAEKVARVSNSWAASCHRLAS